MTKVHVSLPEDAEAGLQAFIDEVDERLASDEDTCSVVRDTLIDLFGDREAWERWQSGKPVSPATRVRLQGYDPCNATLEAEYYAEKDAEKFKRSKHLQWLWRQFDATPMADNVDFALRFRQLLAKHLFEEAGDNLRIFKGVTFSYGHNISVGDNTVIHDDVHLDDRGKLTIGDRVSISDSAHIYSHSHDIVDQTEVRNYHTTIGDDARITYDAMINAGVSVGENAIVGARSVVQGDVPAHHIAVGSPAKSVKIKPGFEDVAEPLDAGGERRADERELPYDLPDAIDTFDEFDRDVGKPVQPHRTE
ncbi:acyltransferase [Haloferax mediterranei ATCC 33500]|uniref:Acetyltransferase n=1 Tax=Haloferax mediterranei (strain ATCC 33500 / DSM 1411 / JCM 8866 / NBRC 14739 / NCIMB 2177 / R-4) TaxID=523841 RepID=I3R5Z5_HALMT|nr:acyltransferase [Haloferax mediterranei]AFK19655.1 maltose O-acetyltransferase [Haloferax mediterranei ATCC 33500]AHZ23043.1 acetyltransferase [Haloferax mediterranei ATCC 33500]ELZ99974.1 maltose O-acetyltransferase [Haloferax mediterranei ATCC 33500]MDX5987604.1 acyltransferase [Haloferax mediterranei ATCC 33500]QCQ74092.1 acyltransferase [Haloferax mediterranei ATCC 33500]